MSEPYNPLNHSVVQASVGTWEQFQVDDYVDALFEAILNEIERIHWNLYQHVWGPTWHADEVENPEIEGISFVRFYADRCDCGGNADSDCPKSCIGRQPNFEFDGVRFTWYKRPGRGMSTNKDWTPLQWKEWFDKCMNHIREFERSCDHTFGGETERYKGRTVRKEFYEKYKHVSGVRDCSR
jgi:hypothetical protein